MADPETYQEDRQTMDLYLFLVLLVSITCKVLVIRQCSIHLVEAIQ